MTKVNFISRIFNIPVEKRKKVLCALAFFIGSFAIICTLKFFRCDQHDVCKALKQIPVEDRYELESLFRTLVTEDSFGYVLFGDKPIAFASYIANVNWGSYRKLGGMKCFFSSLRPSNLHIQNGLQKWKKYQHLFPSKKYILKVYHEKSEIDWPFIILINRQTFIDKVANHLEDFRAVLGPDVSPEGVLKKAIESDSFFCDVLKMREGLFGTLLGYGRNNSQLFERKFNILGMHHDLYFSFNAPNPRPSSGFATTEEELNHLTQKLKRLDVSYPTPFTFIIPISFMVDRNDPETKIINHQLKKTQKKITALYREGPFLETTLKAFTDTL